MIVPHCKESPLHINNLPQPTRERQPAKEKSLSSDGPLIASAHYKAAKDRKAQMNRRKAVKFRDHKPLINDSQPEVSISKSYSKR